VQTWEGLRARTKDKPDDPSSVTRYLEGKFGEALPDVRAAMEKLTRSLPPNQLATSAFGPCAAQGVGALRGCTERARRQDGFSGATG